MMIAKDKAIALFWSLIVLFISFFLLPLYTDGDQIFYRRFYSGVEGLSILEAWRFYGNSLGASEPFYFLLVYTLSPYISKDALFSLVNFALAYLTFLWALRRGVNQYIIACFLLNFYFLVILFSAERLKVSLFLIALGVYARGGRGAIIWGASVLSHVQAVMLLVSLQTSRLNRLFKRLLVGRLTADVLVLVVVALIAGATLMLLFDHVLQKLEHYQSAWGGWGAVLKPLAFTLLAAYCAKARWHEAVLASMPMIVASFFVGSERTAIFSYAVFMYYGVQYRKGKNIPVAATSIYFGVKGAIFAANLVGTGDGFAGS